MSYKVTYISCSSTVHILGLSALERVGLTAYVPWSLGPSSHRYSIIMGYLMTGVKNIGHGIIM